MAARTLQTNMAKYAKKEKVGEAMHKYKRGQLKSGSKKTVKNPRQAIAIGLSQARKKGAKVPPPPRKRASKKTTPKKTTKKAGTRTAKKSKSRRSQAKKRPTKRRR